MISSSKAQKILKTLISKGKRERIDWDKWQAWYLSEDPTAFKRAFDLMPNQEPNASELQLDTNYPYAFIDTMVANICPTNPQITVNARDKDRTDAARAREAIVNDTFKRDKLHVKAWDMSVFGGMCGRAFSKTVWSLKHGRPVTRVINPRNIFYDMSLDWEDARYVIEAVPMTAEEFDERCNDPDDPYDKEVAENADRGQIPSWLVDRDTLQSFLNSGSRDVFEWVIVYEFYDLTSGQVSHLIENNDKPLWSGAKPYAYLDNPYSKVIFNKNMIDESGVSDVKLIARLQERLNEIDALELWYAHTSIPIPLFNESAVEDIESATTSFANATGPGDICRLRLSQGQTFDSAIAYTKPPAMVPSFDKMREECKSKIEFILGIPQYARGVVGAADVATEVALADTATRTRNGRRIKVIEDWVIDVTMKTLALWREYMPAKQMMIRGRTNFDTVLVDRQTLAFPNPIDPASPDAAEMASDDMYYDYEAVPYSPTENHKLIQIQKLQQFMQVLVNNPAIDPMALMTKLCQLLGIEEVLRDPNAAPAGPQLPMPGTPPGGQAPSMQGDASDVIPTNGNLPPGVEEGNQAILPQSPLASQAKV